MFISKRKHEPAHYMLKIESFSILSEAKTSKIESDVFEANGYKWRLDLYPNGNDEENGAGHISLYVVICDTETCSKGWEISVDVCFFVYDHIHHNYVTFQDVNGHRTRFHEKKMTWGFDKLIPLESFVESKNGYLLNDSCVFGVEVIAVPEFTQVDRCLLMTRPPAIMNTYTWTINKFSTVTEDVLYSEVFKVGKVKWKLKIYPKGYGLCIGTHLSFFLGVHDTASFPDGWKVYAKFKLRLKKHGLKSDIEEETDNWFCNSADDWGFSGFILLSELNDSENGFLLNDNLTVEAEISVMGTLRYFF
ncbi:putative ubiquitinyl hydrolase 1 [Helianthus annuus]|uniref:Ubiquitinyl hydrolase 1 n=3 Tax=Helianthus annuus TaxID=4232 RepID=A0A9K3NUU5_HELAN|nr:MATH domain and coiled-coil domain-containing protein At3g58200 isoform X3 [Helianthus annuus]XP_022027929.1 MATH domain and coiled-coil domain-containing protein At3g58200 isoform X3 [Helianthus annuus]KAF5814147.1 putative ubiquitinyl hydrolase 1 [Helianthus annuus]KAJ0592822.1 putative ubiquitinyl hydrolase 1 [Helianthus annuus]KAJ0600486.1 putative ubiquitinyl hydrolase 1 [Helianthus annuus]KAJ0607823.1 putative ubiquitinyl hydrolase 1 [Helianthus annuus]KAJ0767887.1 putative ubiquitin